MNHLVVSKCSRNHFISDKSKTVSFKQHFLQNSPLVQFCKNLFSPSVSFLMTSVTSQKCRPFNANFSQGNGWNKLEPGQDHCCHIVLCKEILDQNRPVCWSIVVRWNQLLVLHLSGRLLLTASLRPRRMSLYLSLFIEIPVNYTCQFRNNFKLLRTSKNIKIERAGTSETLVLQPQEFTSRNSESFRRCEDLRYHTKA
jgi:hypothetical protein